MNGLLAHEEEPCFVAHSRGGLNPLIIGFLVLSIGLSLGGTTGFAINPARDLGPRIAHFFLPIKGKGPSDWGYAWIPVVGPLLGGAFGALFYQQIFSGVNSAAFWIVGAICIATILSAQFVDKEHRVQPKVIKKQPV